MAADGSKRATKIPVMEERVTIDKEIIDTGTVRVVKKVDEDTVTLPLTGRLREYTIEHVSVDKYIDVPPEPVRYEGTTMIISVVQEEAVVIKKLKLVEEVRITPLETETMKETEVTLKKERITVERDPPEMSDEK